MQVKACYLGNILDLTFALILGKICRAILILADYPMCVNHSLNMERKPSPTQENIVSTCLTLLHHYATITPARRNAQAILLRNNS